MEPRGLAATTWSVIPAFDVPPNAPATLTRSGGRPSLYHPLSFTILVYFMEARAPF